MSGDTKTDDLRSTVCAVDGVDDPRRRRATEYCDARQLLSETLRLRRAAQLQRAAAAAAAGETVTPPATTTTTTTTSGLRRSAAEDATSTAKRRKKVVRGTTADKPRPPRARRIMFHEYKGPSEDGAEMVAATPVPHSAAAQLHAVPPSLYFTSPNVTARLFSSNGPHHDGSGGGGSGCLPRPFVGSADFDCFRPTTSSPLPRFSELQRSLQRVDAGRQGMVVGRSSCPPSTFCRSTTTTLLPVTSSFSSPSVDPATQLQRRHPLSVTSPADITSGLPTNSGGVDHVTAVPPSVVAAYRSSDGKQSVIWSSSRFHVS